MDSNEGKQGFNSELECTLKGLPVFKDPFLKPGTVLMMNPEDYSFLKWDSMISTPPVGVVTYNEPFLPIKFAQTGFLYSTCVVENCEPEPPKLIPISSYICFCFMIFALLFTLLSIL